MNLEIVSVPSDIFEPTFLDKVFSSVDLTEKSKKDYLYRIQRFVSFVQNRKEFDRNSLMDYKRSLSLDTTITTTTKNKYLIVSRVFCQQLYRLGILKIDLTSGVKSFRSTSNFKTNGFTEDETNRIKIRLEQLEDIRLKTIITLKMFSGLRDIEITRLRVEDMDLNNSVIHVLGKGRDGTEPLPIIPQVVDTLRTYLTSTGKRSGYLFTSVSRRNHGGSLTTKTVWLLVRGFLDDLGIHKNPHNMRSFFTTRLIERMGNLFHVIPFTRHRNIETLQRYYNYSNNSMLLPKYNNTFYD